MIGSLQILFITCIVFITSCTAQTNTEKGSKYSSAITFLYYENFSYGIQVMEDVLQLELVSDEGFARVYQVNKKAFIGIVKKKNLDEQSGNTLFSLTTQNIEAEYDRVKQLDVHNLTEIKLIESIPLISFFFDDAEGHNFEIQQFVNEEDILMF